MAHLTVNDGPPVRLRRTNNISFCPAALPKGNSCQLFFRGNAERLLWNEMFGIDCSGRERTMMDGIEQSGNG